mgnify:CR=1 FL=1
MKSILLLIIPFLTFTPSTFGQTNDDFRQKRTFGLGFHAYHPGEVDEYKNGLGFGLDFIFFNSSEQPAVFFSGSYSNSFTLKEDFEFFASETDLTILTGRFGIALNPVMIPYMSVSKLGAEVNLTSDQTSSVNLNLEDDPKIGGGLMFRLPLPHGTSITIRAEYNGSLEQFGGAVGIQL